jgi:hypothetical protein
VALRPHLLRRFVSVDVAAGGTGKSSVKIGEALAMASGRNLYGVRGPRRPAQRLALQSRGSGRGIGAPHPRDGQVVQDRARDVDGRLYVDSGRDQRCVIATETEYGARIAQPVYEQIKAQLLERKIDVLIIDPFVSSHEVSENDNRAIDAVVKAWGRLADECNCSINLVHHVRKGNGTESQRRQSARGAKALVDAARSVQVFNRMSPDEASLAGIAEDQRGFYFRVQNDKANLAPPDKAAWYRMNNVSLDNGDQVGVACPWKWPELFEGISTRHLIAVQKAVEAGEWRADPAPRMGRPPSPGARLDVETAASASPNCSRNGSRTARSRSSKRGRQRMPRKFVVVGKWATE